jgi:hypothetical protein
MPARVLGKDPDSQVGNSPTLCYLRNHGEES